jgi:hypothetical protein
LEYLQQKKSVSLARTGSPVAPAGGGRGEFNAGECSMTEPNSGDSPLHGLQVLDLTENMAGPFCTMILADMGAEVVKLERPGRGDSVRAWGDGSERNPFFRYINRNKTTSTGTRRASPSTTNSPKERPCS